VRQNLTFSAYLTTWVSYKKKIAKKKVPGKVEIYRGMGSIALIAPLVSASAAEALLKSEIVKKKKNVY